MKRMVATTLLSLATVSGTAVASGDSPWNVRVGVSHIATESEPSTTSAGEVRELSSTGLSLNLNYAFTPNWVLDVLGALPFEHDLEVDGNEVGSTRHLPPTVSMKYHFMPGQEFDFYVGGGVNYTIFFDEEIQGADLELDPSFGLAAMVGADYNFVGTQWGLGFDIRYIEIETEASLDGTFIGDVAIDPWVFSTNVSYRF